MATRGVSEWNAFPPLWQILWHLGIAVPPPPFLGFVTLATLSGGLFGPLFAFAVWVLENRRYEGMSGERALWIALIGGAVFGLIMAAYYRHLGRKHRLGSWSAFPAPGLRP
ncbi:DUF6404 family protein [Novilysobacter viscosus]